MKHRAILYPAVALLTFASVDQAVSKEPSGTARCVELRQDAACELRWEFPSNKGRTYTVQQWDRAALEWRDLDERPVHSEAFTRLGALPQGKLYRVLACNKKCLPSNVVWSIDWTRPEQMPDIVEVDMPDRKTSLSVSKVDPMGVPIPAVEVITQYNMYLVIREVASFYETDIPMQQMDIPRMKGEIPAHDSIEEIVAYNVQQDYEHMRGEVLERRRSLNKQN